MSVSASPCAKPVDVLFLETQVQISRLQEEFLSKKNSLDAEMENLKIDADKKLAALNGTVDEVKSTVALQVVTISALQEDVEARKAESARTVAVMAENEASSLLKVKKLQEDLKLEMVIFNKLVTRCRVWVRLSLL